MTNELSPGTGFAGQYGPLSLCAGSGSSFGPLPSETITVYQSDGVTSALDQMWTDRTKTTQASSNQITTDATGTFTFYADPGIYVLSFNVSGTLTTRTVEVVPDYTDDAWNVVADIEDATAVSGDCHQANGTLTVTLPAPTEGSRVMVINVGSGQVEITTPSGVINGPGIASGLVSYLLLISALSVTMIADGTNWHIVAGGYTPGMLLNEIEYAPGALESYTFSSGGMAALDSTNLTIPFAVPPSGRVNVTAEIDVAVAMETSIAEAWLCLLNHVGAEGVGISIIACASTSGTVLTRANLSWLLTGLTPGSLQVDLAGVVVGGSGSTASAYAQDIGLAVTPNAGDRSPAIMRAYAA